MKAKYTILTIGLVVFIVLIYLLYNPTMSDTNVKERKEDVIPVETTKVTDEVSLIDYLNLEGENRKLQEEIESLESDIFELKKIIASSESNIDHYYNSSEFLYKEVTEDEIVMLIRDETDGGYRLITSSKEQDLYNYFNGLQDNESINYTGSDGFYSGLIKESEINAITVNVNDKSYKAKIVSFADDISFWYVIYEHKRKSTLEEPDKIRIEAMNKSGEVFWEESFDGNLGG
ncbi:hypothetical protein [Ornithinibacillus californiensis]|uniref:hypothetical protein n=1 Tax=Ornithinibacillus californiensis TaxID=161536 RepID=UPI00064DC907|nr:hypothetical protein [Ornithinibacillus californiensis]